MRSSSPRRGRPGRLAGLAWPGNREVIDRGERRLIVDCLQFTHLPSIAYAGLSGLSRELRRIVGMPLLVHVSEKNRMVLSRRASTSSSPTTGP
jgi:hypothetical protein